MQLAKLLLKKTPTFAVFKKSIAAKNWRRQRCTNACLIDSTNNRTQTIIACHLSCDLYIMFRCPPLRERVYRGSSFSTRVYPSDHRSASLGSRSTYKQWPEISMEKATKAVIEGMSVRRATEQFSVPKSTLGDRVSGRVQPGSHSGPQKYLTDSEESNLATFLIRCAAIGYARSKIEVLSLVHQILASRGRHVVVSNGWFASFQRRHPELVLRNPSPLSLARSQATDSEMLDRYFDLLVETLVANNLEDKPGQIFNMDESGCPLDAKAPKLVCARGSHPCAVTSGNKTQVTVVACVSAAGFTLPPMVIWDRKNLAPALTVGEVPGTIYGLSSNGWMDMELFDACMIVKWFHNHFLRYAPSARPLLLLLDGHSSHYCPDTIEMAAQEEVIIFTLPANTTHLAQPLDRGCFGPLKQAWKQVCHDFCISNPGRVV